MLSMLSMLFRRAALAACLGLHLALVLASPAQAALPSQFFTWDGADLAYAKGRVAARDPLYLASYDNLLKQADAALGHRRYSVVDKSLAPASGDKHDFFSFGPYWWPDPSKKDGLPYIRKDGLHNPASSTDATDAVRMGRFAHDVTVLGLAWYFTGERKYADHAALLARAWFLDPATRMNPNLDYGQAIPGRVDGRGIAIITSRDLIGVMDSLALIQPTGALSDAENAAVRGWYRAYLDWLLNSRNGFEESNAHNNHGTWYGAQVVAFALYTDQPAVARRELEIAKIRRIPGQIDREGKLVAELERTRPSGYLNFALEAFGNLGRYGELAGEHVWEHGQDAHNIEQGYRYVARFVGDGAERWPYPEIDPKEASTDGLNLHALQNMLAAARAYRNEPLFARKARWLLEHYPGQLAALTLPLRAFTPQDALQALFEVEGQPPYRVPYDGTLAFGALGSKAVTANGHGYRNELKIAAPQRRPAAATREHFSAVVTPVLSAGARTIVAQYHLEGVDTLLKVYVQDMAGNGVFDVLARIRGQDGKETATPLGSVRSGERFVLDVRFDRGVASVSVTTPGGSASTGKVATGAGGRVVYFKFGDYLQAADPAGGKPTSDPAQWDAWLKARRIERDEVVFSDVVFERE